MAEKPQPESFLAQLSEVEVAHVQSQNIDQVLQINPIPVFAAKVENVLNQTTTSIQQDAHEQTYTLSSNIAIVNTSTSEQVHTTNGDNSLKTQPESPKAQSSATPQTVTGNVKIQLMEISVDEFKANVDYIQQRFPSLPRRLVCDTFSKANFDCRMAMELLAKEQEKKDPTIIPPLAAALAKQQQQQHHQHVSQSPKSHTPKAPAAAAAVTTQQTPQAPGTPAANPSAADAVVTPQQPTRQLPLPRTGPRRSQLGAGGVKEDPCYRRVAVPDKDAEIALRQKLKSNVRSRVFNHGVKIAQGRETAATLIQQTPLAMGTEDNEDASRTSMVVDEADASAALSAAAVPEAAETSSASLEPSATNKEVKEDVAPQSPMRILRESFPSMDEARIAETLDSCDQDVDAAIRVLSGRPLLPPGAGAAPSAEKKFFKSRGQVGAYRKEYVKAELITGAWMDHKTAGKMAVASTAAAGVKVSGPSTGPPPTLASLRVFTVQPKRKIKREPVAPPRAAAAAASDEEAMSATCEEDLSYNREQDYDSEDSDYENKHSVQSEEDKAAVLEFFNKSSLSELMHIPTVSKKKAELLYKMRPFEEFDDLVGRLDSHRQFNSSLVQGAREVLHMRRMIVYLMSKCEVITQKLESRVASLMESVTLEGSGGQTGGITLQPATLNPDLHLKPYQLVGLNWLRLLHEENMSAILGDQMGLGKTIQIVAFMAQLLEEGDQGPHLVIVPSSTLINWEREIHKWCPQLQTVTYHGSMEERKALRQMIYSGQQSFQVMLTTYNIATGTLEDRAMMKNLEFEYGIFDEAHMLKNCQSRRYKVLMNFRVKRRILLTGTPLQNNLIELLSLLSFVIPDVFTASRQCSDLLKKMFNLFQRQTTTGSSDEAPGQQQHPDRSTYEMERIQHAQRLMRPFFLRRTKSQVLTQLPPKTEEVMLVPMTQRQRKEYQELVDSLRKRFEASQARSENEVAVNYILQLRKAANHSLLHRRIYTDSRLREMARKMLLDPDHRKANEEYIFEDLAAMNDFEIHRTCLMYPVLKDYVLDEAEHLVQLSGKLEALDKLLPELQAGGHRVAVFSQFVMMLDIVQAYLQMRRIRFLRIDGTTPVQERQGLLDQFAEDTDIPVFLLSTRAGGLGINLTAADTVIIHDIDFNPYNDKQAEDRCHRLGQERPVRVIRMLAADSVEVGVNRIACDKLRLERDVVSDGLPGAAASAAAAATAAVTAMMDEEVGNAAGGQDGDLPEEDGRKPTAVVKREPGLSPPPPPPSAASNSGSRKRRRSAAAADESATAAAPAAPQTPASVVKSSELIHLLSECLGVAAAAAASASESQPAGEQPSLPQPEGIKAEAADGTAEDQE